MTSKKWSNFIERIKASSFYKTLEEYYLMLKNNYKEVGLILFFAFIPARILYVFGETNFALRISVLLFCLFILLLYGNWIIPYILDSRPFQLILFMGLWLEDLLLSSFTLSASVLFSVGCLLPTELDDILFPCICIILVLLTYEKFVNTVFNYIDDPEIPPIQDEEELNWETVTLMLSSLSNKSFNVKVQNRLPKLSSYSYPFIAKRYVFEEAMKEGVKKVPRKYAGAIVGATLAGWGLSQYKDYSVKMGKIDADERMKSAQLQSQEKIKLAEIQSEERVRMAQISSEIKRDQMNYEARMAQIRAEIQRKAEDSKAASRNWWASTNKDVKAPSMESIENPEIFQVIETCFSKVREIFWLFF